MTSLLQACIFCIGSVGAVAFAMAALHVWRDPNYEWRQQQAEQRRADAHELARWLNERGA